MFRLYLVSQEESGWGREKGDCRHSRLNHDSEEFPAAGGPYAVMLLQVEKTAVLLLLR